jgi:hypothetical protein
MRLPRSYPLAGDNPAEAVRSFVGPLQRAISCVTRSQLRVSQGGYAPSVTGQPHGLLLNGGRPVALSGPERPQLFVSLGYDVVHVDDPERGPWKVSTRSYRYHILTNDGTESVLYHWHPDGKSHVTRPHMHIGNSLLSRDAVITRKAHMPSGRIALELVVWLLLDEYGVPPLRDDAHGVLDECLDRFERYRTWH